MMRSNTLIALLAICFFVTSCGNEKPQINADAKLMAALECKAYKLKVEREKAANDIRHMADSLAKHKLPLTDLQSQQIDSLKIKYTALTAELASKITKTLDSLFAKTYRTPEQRRELDAETAKIKKEICP